MTEELRPTDHDLALMSWRCGRCRRVSWASRIEIRIAGHAVCACGGFVDAAYLTADSAPLFQGGGWPNRGDRSTGPVQL